MTRRCCGALWTAVAMLPASAWALGFGDIHLKSALNAPLDAEIDLTATAEELSSVRAGLASREQFARNGIEYPAFLGSASVKVAKSADGRDVLQLRTTDPVTEPFLTMLVQVSYARGQLVREYTVLLDPPVFAGQSGGAAVAAPATGTQSRGGEVDRSAAAAPAATASGSDAGRAAVAPAATVTSPAAAAPGGAGTYRVQAGDTLSGIVARQLPGAERRAALLGTYRANPQAFDGNMNVLRRGAVLTLPTDADLARVAPDEARAEVGRQFRAWSDQRGNGRLRLVPPSEAGSQAGGGGGGSGAAGSASTGALQQRVNELEQQLAEKDRLLTLRNAELARLQQRGAAGTSGGTVTKTPPAVAPAPAPTPAPVPTPAPTPAPGQAPSADMGVGTPTAPTVKAPMAAAPSKPAPEEPSLLDWLMERWYVPVAGLALLVAAAIALRVRRSRQDRYGDRHFDQFGGTAAGTLVGESSQTLPARQLPDTDSIVVEETGSHRRDGGTGVAPTPTIAVSDDGSSAAAEMPAAAPEGSGVGLDQGDPLAEADFHMAYGLYDQAAELVSQAIAREPERRELKLKLLEVYFVWGNKQKFEELAGELSRRRDDAVPGEWEKIVIMGRQIAPDNALFSNPANIAGAAAGSVDLNLEGGQNRVDFNLMGEPSVSSGRGEGVDLDLGEALADLPGVEAGARPPGESGVDFLLDTPVRGESGELYTQMMPTGTLQRPASGGHGGDDTAGEAPTAEVPKLDLPEEASQGTIRMKLDGPAAKPQGGSTSPDNTAELALDDLGLDLGAMDASAGGAGDTEAALPAGEEIVLTGAAPGPHDLETGPDGNWLLQGTDDSSEHTAIAPPPDAPAVTAEHPAFGAKGFPGASGAAPLADSEQPTRLAPKLALHGEESGELLAEELDAALSALPADAGNTTVGHIEALSGAELQTQEMAAPTGLLGGLSASAATALLPTQGGGSGGGTRSLPVAPAVLPEMDPPTMSEVGTKLDLARAYMDMGDPEGARSILDEVLSEGSASQKQEARRLIDSLPG